jgi:serine/threonine-protein phosphatase 5
LKKAEEYKEQGNQLLKQNKFSESLEKFSDAISLNIETNKNSIYLSNRALIHIKMENYGLAVEGNRFYFI